MIKKLLLKLIKRIKFWIVLTIPLNLRYTPKKNNILILANRRGGSTLLQHLLSVDKKTRVVSEPFDTFPRKSKANKLKNSLLPDTFFSQFIDFDKKVEEYLDELLSGKHLELGFYWFTNRSLLKVLNAHPLVDYLNTRPDVKTVFFIRHPAAQSLSLVRNNWGYTAVAYLNNKNFCDSYLSKDQKKFANEILNNGDNIEKAFISWCLENLYPLKFAKSNFLLLTYEELIINTNPIINLLADKFEIKNVSKMFNVISNPSNSSHRSTTETISQIKESNKVGLIGKWNSAIDENMRQKLQNTLHVFEIDEYNMNSLSPNERLLLINSSKEKMEVI